MPKTMKDYSGAKHSNAPVTPDCESVNAGGKSFDFSAFNKYLTKDVYPDELIEYLEDIRTSYLELSLHVLLEMEGMNPGRMLPHEDVQTHIYYLSSLINLIKTLQS